MGYKLHEVTEDSDFAELSKVEREAFENPVCRLMELYFPLHGPIGDETLRQAAIKEATSRQIAWRKADPTSTWVKVVDDNTGKLVGAALWHVYDQDPYAAPSDDEHGCTWFAEGEERDIANSLIEQFFVTRMAYMRKPHVFLDIFFTAPEARCKGVGSLMMEWGIKEADKRGYESYIDATEMGRQLYKKFGFVEDRPRDFTLDAFPQTPVWRELGPRLVPFRWWPMYRPAYGRFDERAEVPWKNGSA